MCCLGFVGWLVGGAGIYQSVMDCPENTYISFGVEHRI